MQEDITGFQGSGWRGWGNGKHSVIAERADNKWNLMLRDYARKT